MKRDKLQKKRPNIGRSTIDCMKIYLGPQSFKITPCIQFKSPLILKNKF